LTGGPRRKRGGRNGMSSPSPPVDTFATADRYASSPLPAGRQAARLVISVSAIHLSEAGAPVAPNSPTSVTTTAFAGGPRQVPRSRWQPDSEAEECSLLACDQKFGNYSNRRHHCRQCGRVVCAACSGRMKMLLPPNGVRGSARNVRVCEACFLSQETFSFPRSGSVNSMGSVNSVDVLPTEMHSPAVPTRKGTLKSSMSSPAILQLLLSVKGENSMMSHADCHDKADTSNHQSPRTTEAAAAGSPTLASGADTQTPSSPNSDSKSSKGTTTTSPVRVPRGNAEQTQVEAAAEDPGAAEHLLEDVAPADDRRREWIANVQKKFGADPHYHAMLKYEPQALKALITCTMAPPT